MPELTFETHFFRSQLIDHATFPFFRRIRTIVSVFSAFVFLIVHVTVGAGQEPAKPLGFSMVPRKSVLKNGVTVLVNEDHSSSVTACQITYAIGVQHEQESEAGIRHLLAHVVYGRALECRPTAAGRAVAFDDLAESRIAHDLVSFGFKVSTTAIDDALARSVRVLSATEITDAALTRARSVVLREIQDATAEEGSSLANPRAVYAAAYRDSEFRLSRPLLGDAGAISKLDVKQLREFVGREFVASRCSVTLVGDIDFTTAIQLASRFYGFLPTRALSASSGAPLKEATAWTRVDQLTRGDREWLATAYRDDTADPTDWAASLILAELLQRRLDRIVSGEPPERDLELEVDLQGTLMNASCRPAFLRIGASEYPGRSYTIWQLEDQIHEVVSAYLKQGAPAYEVDAAARRTQFTLDRALENLSSRAWLFAISTMRTGSEFTVARLADRLGRLQADEVLDSARATLVESRLVTITLSKGAAAGTN